MFLLLHYLSLNIEFSHKLLNIQFIQAKHAYDINTLDLSSHQ